MFVFSGSYCLTEHVHRGVFISAGYAVTVNHISVFAPGGVEWQVRNVSIFYSNGIRISLMSSGSMTLMEVAL